MHPLSSGIAVARPLGQGPQRECHSMVEIQKETRTGGAGIESRVARAESLAVRAGRSLGFAGGRLPRRFDDSDSPEVPFAVRSYYAAMRFGRRGADHIQGTARPANGLAFRHQAGPDQTGFAVERQDLGLQTMLATPRCGQTMIRECAIAFRSAASGCSVGFRQRSARTRTGRHPSGWPASRSDSRLAAVRRCC